MYCGISHKQLQFSRYTCEPSGRMCLPRRYKWQVEYSRVSNGWALHNYFIPCHRKYSGQFTTDFLHPDELYFRGIKTCIDPNIRWVLTLPKGIQEVSDFYRISRGVSNASSSFPSRFLLLIEFPEESFRRSCRLLVVFTEAVLTAPWSTRGETASCCVIKIR